MTFQELQDNEKLKFWYMHITNCTQAGTPIVTYCKENGLNPSTFYVYKKRIRELLLNQTQSVVLVPENAISSEQKVKDRESNEITSNDSVTISKGQIKIEIPSNASLDTAVSLLKVLLC